MPSGRFTMPIREGTDVQPFQLLPPRLHVDPIALANRMRPLSEFRSVSILIRQTARFPIAALSDGLPFRNSVLAGFESDDWPASTLVALLNSALIRWFHFVRFRDARQAIMPQVKIGHLRSIPAPPEPPLAVLEELNSLGEELSRPGVVRGPTAGPLLRQLDDLVFGIYGVTAEEASLVRDWQAQHCPYGVRRQHNCQPGGE